MAKGFAIVDDGQISVRSVSPTERGAKVNFLCTDRLVMVASSFTDEAIAMLWKHHAKDAVCVPVVIVVDKRGSN